MDTGAALAGAVVSAQGTDLAAETGTDGIFLLEGVRAGTVALTASLSGYRSGSVTAQVPVDGSARADIYLQPESEPPRLCVDPLFLDFAEMIEPLPVTVSNCGGGYMYWSARPDQGWIRVQPGSGRVGAGADMTLYMGVNRTGLPPGDYKGAVRIKSDGGDALIEVKMVRR